MNQHLLRSFVSELQAPMVKQALIERLVRLAATDVEELPGVRRLVKSTPRMFMRKRSPEELAQLQHGVQSFFDKYEQPAIAKAKGMIDSRVGQHPRVAKALNAGAAAVIKNPELALTELSPLPGTGVAWLGTKKGLERAIDRLAPIPPPR